MFSNYKIPKDYLLSKTGDVDDAGNFVSQIKDPKKRMGASFGALSGGRVGICEIATTYGVKAITIAIRYAASRKQFGPEDSSLEYPVIEYQAQQYRLLPHLASIYAVQFFATSIGKVYADMMMRSLSGENIAKDGVEMHALSSAAKSVCTWTVRDVIQECREACGGHGYLKCARLGTYDYCYRYQFNFEFLSGDLRNETDANCTYEGENNILIQQASNFLINTRAKGWSAFNGISPLGTVDFFKDGESIKNTKWMWNKEECAIKPDSELKSIIACNFTNFYLNPDLLATFNWICVFLLDKSFERVKQLKANGQSQFDVRNNSQVFHAINLAIAYGHRSIFSAFYQHIQTVEQSPEKDVLMKLLSLYGANLIVKNYLGLLYEGGYMQTGVNAGELLQSGILNILPVLKKEAISLVDAIAPPDFIVDSPLGKSDGRIYEHLKAVIYQTPETFTRPQWWKDMMHRDEYIKSKM